VDSFATDGRLIVDITPAAVGGGKRARRGAAQQKQGRGDDDEAAPASAGETDDEDDDMPTMPAEELKVHIKAGVELLKQEKAYGKDPEIKKMVERVSALVDQPRQPYDLLNELKGAGNMGELIGVTATNGRVLGRIGSKLMKVARGQELAYLTSMERIKWQVRKLIKKTFMLLYQECYTQGSQMDHKRFERELLLAFKDEVKQEGREEARSSRFLGGLWA
jgi:hypothetical protein